MLAEGTKLFLSHRRIFDRDQSRYFVGTVLAYQDGLVKVSGYSFVRDMSTGAMLRKDDIRTRIVSLSSGFFIVYELPATTDVASATLETEGNEMLLVDGKDLRLNLAENARQGKI